MTEEDDLCFFWLLDTRKYWLGTKIDDAASNALQCLTSDERAKARAFYFLKDAKLSVASSLLKRFFIFKSLDRPWLEARFSRQGDEKHGKPGYVSSASETSRVDFNVSHQAGLVALAGGRSPSVSFGVDIVCVNERDNAQSIQRKGFDTWVDGFEDIFSPEDMEAMKAKLRPEQEFEIDSLLDIEAKMRRFYAFWALKEAYVKLVGEGLIARWLKEVVFRNVRIPSATKERAWGETINGIEVWVGGYQKQGVTIILQAFEANYMIATAIQQPPTALRREFSFGGYEILDPEWDILPYGVKDIHE